MAVVFKSVVDEVNCRTFECLVHISYFKPVPDEYKQVEEAIDCFSTQYSGMVNTVIFRDLPLPTSFYNPVNTDQREKSRLTLPDMLDLYIKKTCCELINDLDAVHILHLCDNYMLYAEKFVRNKVESAVEFIRDLSAFRKEVLYPNFRRMVYKYPPLMDAYKLYNTGLNKTWAALLGGVKEDFKDGIARLKHPPYDIDNIIKPKQVNPEADATGLEAAKSKDDDYLKDIFKIYES